MKKERARQLDLFVWEPEEAALPEPSSRKAPAPPPEPAVQVKRRPSGPDQQLRVLAQRLMLDLGMPDLAKRVEVVWNPRLRTTAGRAWHNRQRVELNPKLVEVSPEEIDRTLRHELAHLVAQARVGKKRILPHGQEWMLACAQLGIAGEARCHDLNFGRTRQKRTWAYDCPSCEKRILRVRRIRTVAACYDCCQEHSRGRYHSRFRLVEVRLRDQE